MPMKLFRYWIRITTEDQGNTEIEMHSITAYNLISALIMVLHQTGLTLDNVTKIEISKEGPSD